MISGDVRADTAEDAITVYDAAAACGARVVGPGDLLRSEEDPPYFVPNLPDPGAKSRKPFT